MTRVQKCLAMNIKKYRKKLNFTQEQLAERAKTSTTYIGTIEIGQKFPSPQMIERIADALNVDSLKLFQPGTNTLVENKLDIDMLKKSLLKNLETAVEISLEDI
jgi:transcriptional regulator with XRE-family HTH domain